MQETDSRKDFFISYTIVDREWAEWIAWSLEEAGYSTVFHAWDSGPGTRWAQDMDDAMQEAKRTIAILSPAYLNSVFTQVEWQSAFMQDPNGRLRLLLPVRVRQAEVKGILAGVGYIDLLNLDEEEAKKRLLRGLQPIRNKPTSRPKFPGRPKFPDTVEATSAGQGSLEITRLELPSTEEVTSSEQSLKLIPITE